MAVVEYMLHVYDGDHRRHIPGFIGDRGHWYHPGNHTWVGWTKTNPDFYVPDTLVVLSKQDLADRCWAIHQIEPISVYNPANPGPENRIILQTEAEVRAHAEQWYDEFVARNLAEEAAN
jgi:hypothetical protein